MKSLVEIIPLLFLGIVIPFCIGYIRGAISIVFINRSIVERMRGWVYLIMGVFGYFGYVLSSRQPNLISIWIREISGNSGLILLGNYADLTGMWIILYSIAAVGLVLTFVLQRGFIEVFGVGERLSHQYSFFGAIATAFLLSFVSRMFVSLYSDLSARPQFSPYLMLLLTIFIWITCLVAITCLAFEKISRSVINTDLCLDTTHIQRRRHRNFAAKVFLLNIDIYRFVFSKITNFQVNFAQAWWIGVIFGLLGWSFLVFIPIFRAFPFFSTALLWISIPFFISAAIYFWKMEIDFSEFW